MRKFLGCEYLLTLNSATAGLTLATRLLKNVDKENNWPGFDEVKDVVLAPALTCFAGSSYIIDKVKIRWLDVDLNNANISLEDVKKIK